MSNTIFSKLVKSLKVNKKPKILGVRPEHIKVKTHHREHGQYYNLVNVTGNEKWSQESKMPLIRKELLSRINQIYY